MPRKRKLQQEIPPVARDEPGAPRCKPLSFPEWVEAARAINKSMPPGLAEAAEATTRIARMLREYQAEIDKNTPRPVDPEQWREVIAKLVPPPRPAGRAKAGKRSALRRGARRKYDEGRLKQLAARYPSENNKELLRRYEQATGQKPSLSWVRDCRQKFGR
jgi:hypothetical protein